jgi:hypothetical protein
VAVADQQGISGALTKYVIPAAEIGRVRDQLDLVGIDERRLFPDLSGLASELRVTTVEAHADCFKWCLYLAQESWIQVRMQARCPSERSPTGYKIQC